MEFVFRPLQKWPRASTPHGERKRRPFNLPSRRHQDAAGNWQYVNQKPMPVSRTYEDLRRELNNLDAADPVVIEIGLRERDIRISDNLPRSNAPQPEHPGVIVSFTGMVADRPTPLRFMCDDCEHWEDNLRAIALTLERLRLADLYGVTKSGEQYRGWNALPPAKPIITPPAMTVEEAARFVANAVGMGPSYPRAVGDPAQFREWYREAALKLHPDPNGGGPASADWHSLQAAKSVLDRHHGL